MLSSVKRLCGIAPTSATTGCLKHIMFTTSAAIIPTSEAGTTAFHFLGHTIIITITSAPNITAHRLGEKLPSPLKYEQIFAI